MTPDQGLAFLIGWGVGLPMGFIIGVWLCWRNGVGHEEELPPSQASSGQAAAGAREELGAEASEGRGSHGTGHGEAAPVERRDGADGAAEPSGARVDIRRRNPLEIHECNATPSPLSRASKRSPR